MRCIPLLLVLGFAFGCSTSTQGPTPTDAGRDVAVVDVAPPVDAAPSRCASDRECSARAQVCNTQRGVCVDCNTATDCTNGRVCLGDRCVTPSRCTSSRTCPGQVCSTRLGYCVDCETDVDCTNGQVCRANVCVEPPRPCRSSRECSDIGLVCATVRGYCVECVADTDCPMDRYCGAMQTCLARVCVPNATRCASAARVSACNAVGSAEVESACPAGQTCRDNRCQTPVCTPAQVSCDPTTFARRRCDDDGGGYTAMPCADGETCRDGACVPRACVPGAATCTSMTERRVCAPDGLSTMIVACGSGEGCRDGACVTRMCVPGAGICTSTAMRNVCNADGFGVTPMACGAAQRCALGECVDLACAPGSSMCLDARTVRVCSADGTSFMNVTCPASSTCAGSRCSGWVCTPGAASCPSGATARTICNDDGLATRNEPCVAPLNATSARCGADNACTFTCNAGFGDCNRVTADGCEVNGFSDPLNCGGCGNVCATRANSATSCVAGACEYRCNTGFADCDGVAANGCEASLSSSTSCGRCGAACPVGMSCAGGACSSEPTFRIDALSIDSSACRTIDHSELSGDDRGGITVSGTHVFYTGDTATVRASAVDLGGLASVGTKHDVMLSDLASNEVYVLLNAVGAELSYNTVMFPYVVTQLGVLNGSTGVLTSTRIPLSAPISLNSGSGIFSGRGRAYVYTPGTGALGGTWLQIRLPAGTVTTLRTMVPMITRQFCENWAIWGVAEYFDGEPYAVFVESGMRIVRYRIRDGAITTLVDTRSTVTLSDMCSLTVSPMNHRWYFHYEGAGFAGGTNETLGYCPATLSTP